MKVIVKKRNSPRPIVLTHQIAKLLSQRRVGAPVHFRSADNFFQLIHQLLGLTGARSRIGLGLEWRKKR